MQTLTQFLFLLNFVTFASLAGFTLDQFPVVALGALVIAALSALVAVVLVLEETAEQRAWQEFKARQK